MQSVQTLCLAYNKLLQIVAVIVNFFCGSTVCKTLCLFLPISVPNMRLNLTPGNYMIQTLID